MGEETAVPVPDSNKEMEELRAENALFRIALTGVFQELTNGGSITQPTFDLLRQMQAKASAPTNILYDKLTQYKKIADAASGVFEYMIQDATRRTRVIGTLKKALAIKEKIEDEDDE